MMSYGGVRFGMGDLAEDARAAGELAAAGPLARVTTNDAAPAGDLILRVSASESAAMVPGGGAEKDGIVAIVSDDVLGDGVWSEVVWPGGPRRPASRGFAHRRFLVKLAPSSPGASPDAPDAPAGEHHMSTATKVALGAGIAAAGVAAWWALK